MSKGTHPAVLVLDLLTGAKAKKSVRLLTFLKNPHLETTGWAYKLTPAFNEALDIKMTDRVNDAVKGKTWTQGRDFNFKTGDVIHSSDSTIVLQVTSSSSATHSDEYSVEGIVQYDVFEIKNGKYAKKHADQCSQIMFIRKLIEG